MRTAALTLLAAAVHAAPTPAPIKFSTGTLSFGAPGKAYVHSSSLTVAAPGLEGAARGPWAVAFDETHMGTMRATLISTLAPCGSLVGFLPPSNFLIHIRDDAGACLARVAAVDGVLGVSSVPAPLLTDPYIPATPSGPPLRILTLELAKNTSFEELSRDLSSGVLALCPLCAFMSIDAEQAAISSVEDCAAECTIDAPVDCGCTLPEAVAAVVAAHPNVLWTSRYEAVHTFNAFSTATIDTSNYVSSATVQTKWGTCPDTAAINECGMEGLLPFVKIGPAYGPFPVGMPRANRSSSSVSDEGVARRTGEKGMPIDLEAMMASIPSVRDYNAAALGETAGPLPPCSAQCASGACGQGYGRCNRLVAPNMVPPPSSSVGLLTGVGQTVQVADTGLYRGSPFFLDPAFPPGTGAAGNTPSAVPNPFSFSGDINFATLYPTATYPRKVLHYWGYADGRDNTNGRGHGTHCAGSVAGDASTDTRNLTWVAPQDRALLSQNKGTAYDATILVADIGCSTPPALGTCARGGIVPPRFGGCGNGALCIPSTMNLLFQSAYLAGARISSNSWGGGTNSAYAAQTAALDAWVYGQGSCPTCNNPDSDFLLVFSAANSGGGGFYTISQQAGAKNVLAIGAASDGILGHLAKTQGLYGGISSFPTPTAPFEGYLPPQYQVMDGRSCLGVVLNAANQASPALAPGGACPSPPNAPSCYALWIAGTQQLNGVPGGYGPGSQYGNAQQAELPLCCGCTLPQIVAGCVAQGDCTQNPANAFLSTMLQGFQSVYSTNFPTGFSSLGPTNDHRIKVSGWVRDLFRPSPPNFCCTSHTLPFLSLARGHCAWL